MKIILSAFAGAFGFIFGGTALCVLLVWLIVSALNTANAAEPLTRAEPVVRMVLQEANTEPLAGKVAVAGVALDRAADRRWPNTEAEVVYQGNRSPRTAQFTGMSIPLGRYTEANIEEARLAVELARSGTRPCGVVLWYHADWIEPPHWTRAMAEQCRIGEHIFYGDRSQHANN